MSKFILTADIGGTNPRLAMVQVKELDNYHIVAKKGVNKNQDSVINEINDFLRECGEHGWTTNTCCACVAGPIDEANNACFRPTNAKFPLVGADIVENTYIENIRVINDFKAIGEAVATINLLKKSKKIIQVPGYRGDDYSGEPDLYIKPDPHGARGVIGPGTGLGVAYLAKTPQGYYVSGSEGGHAGFPTRGDFDLLFQFLRNKLKVSHISMETLVSGQGIRHIIDFFLQHPHAFLDILKQRPEFMEDVKEYEEKSRKEYVSDEQIRQAILDEMSNPLKVDVAKLVASSVEKNPKAKITMRLFMEFLGCAAQAVALHGLTTGGLFIAGGIPAKNKKLLMNGDFMKSFCDNWKPNIRNVLKKIPVYLILDYDISFYGCARVAHMEFRNRIASSGGYKKIIWHKD